MVMDFSGDLVEPGGMHGLVDPYHDITNPQYTQPLQQSPVFPKISETQGFAGHISINSARLRPHPREDLSAG